MGVRHGNNDSVDEGDLKKVIEDKRQRTGPVKRPDWMGRVIRCIVPIRSNCELHQVVVQLVTGIVLRVKCSASDSDTWVLHLRNTSNHSDGILRTLKVIKKPLGMSLEAVLL